MWVSKRELRRQLQEARDLAKSRNADVILLNQLVRENGERADAAAAELARTRQALQESEERAARAVSVLLSDKADAMLIEHKTQEDWCEICRTYAGNLIPGVCYDCSKLCARCRENPADPRQGGEPLCESCAELVIRPGDRVRVIEGSWAGRTGTIGKPLFGIPDEESVWISWDVDHNSPFHEKYGKEKVKACTLEKLPVDENSQHD